MVQIHEVIRPVETAPQITTPRLLRELPPGKELSYISGLEKKLSTQLSEDLYIPVGEVGNPEAITPDEIKEIKQEIYKAEQTFEHPARELAPWFVSPDIKDFKVGDKFTTIFGMTSDKVTKNVKLAGGNPENPDHRKQAAERLATGHITALYGMVFPNDIVNDPRRMMALYGKEDVTILSEIAEEGYIITTYTITEAKTYLPEEEIKKDIPAKKAKMAISYEQTQVIIDAQDQKVEKVSEGASILLFRPQPYTGEREIEKEGKPTGQPGGIKIDGKFITGTSDLLRDKQKAHVPQEKDSNYMAQSFLGPDNRCIALGRSTELLVGQHIIEKYPGIQIAGMELMFPKPIRKGDTIYIDTKRINGQIQFIVTNQYGQEVTSGFARLESNDKKN